MKNRWFIYIGSFLLIFVVFLSWIRLPLTQGEIWMSPDETANTYTAAQFAESGRFFIPSNQSNGFLWAHPRSFVLLPSLNRLVPVGFLGMPLILSFGYKIFGLIGILFFTPLLALLTLYPLWKSLPSKWSATVKYLVILIWMAFPTVIIYTNRGAFAQVPLICLMIWIWWLITSKPKITKYIIAGILLGLFALIRPPELIWAIPITIAAFTFPHREIPNSKFQIQWSAFLAPFLLILILGAVFGHQTYNKWLVSGYQLRPIVAEAQTDVAVAEPNTSSIVDILPFSFHPRNIIWNAKNYILFLFWPWILPAIIGVYLLYKQKVWRTKALVLILSFIWTGIFLIGFYGNGIYQDHVLLNQVSIGNSFLRYILPLTLIATLSIGVVLDALWKKWPLKIFALCITIGLVLTGVWQAYAMDDEGILENQNQLLRYNQIREQAAAHISPNAYIISDRSDKIFFPHFNAVSPTPSADQIYEFLKAGNKSYLYLTTQDEQSLINWLDQGLRLTPLFSNDNQTLYDVKY